MQLEKLAANISSQSAFQTGHALSGCVHAGIREARQRRIQPGISSIGWYCFGTTACDQDEMWPTQQDNSGCKYFQPVRREQVCTTATQRKQHRRTERQACCILTLKVRCQIPAVPQTGTGDASRVWQAKRHTAVECLQARSGEITQRRNP